MVPHVLQQGGLPDARSAVEHERKPTAGHGEDEVGKLGGGNDRDHGASISVGGRVWQVQGEGVIGGWWHQFRGDHKQVQWPGFDLGPVQAAIREQHPVGGHGQVVVAFGEVLDDAAGVRSTPTRV